MKRTNISGTGSAKAGHQSLVRQRERCAFTLVELLAVVAIMAIIMGLLVLGLGQSQARGVQMAAAQVASGMGLARQTAITRNTHSMFIVAHRSGSSPTDFYPAEPFRYWAVVYSNRGRNTWSFANDWTALPAGTAFIGLKGEGYDPISWTAQGALPRLGEPFVPEIAPSRAGDWGKMNNFTNITISFPDGGSTSFTSLPFIGFRSSGRAFALQLAGNTNFTPAMVAVVLGECAIADGGRLVLRSTNNITHVETDNRGGRIIVRPRDSYR